MTKKAKKKESSGPVGIVLVSHGDFAEHLLQAAVMILGPQEGCGVVSVGTANGVDDTVGEIKKSLKECDQGGGVLVLSDLFGGTSTTLSLSLANSYKLEVITGMNLPMLIKSLQNRDLPLNKLATLAKEAACQGIKVAGEMLKKRQ